MWAVFGIILFMYRCVVKIAVYWNQHFICENIYAYCSYYASKLLCISNLDITRNESIWMFHISHIFKINMVLHILCLDVLIYRCRMWHDVEHNTKERKLKLRQDSEITKDTHSSPSRANNGVYFMLCLEKIYHEIFIVHRITPYAITSQMFPAICKMRPVAGWPSYQCRSFSLATHLSSRHGEITAIMA